MHIVTARRLRDFWRRHPDAESCLRGWVKEARTGHWESLSHIRLRFPSADQVGKFTVFNIGGNKYRLIVVIHFNRGKIFVQDLLSHADYSRGRWKDD